MGRSREGSKRGEREEGEGGRGREGKVGVGSLRGS